MKRKKFLHSLKHAFNGLKIFFSGELHAFYHSIAAALATAAGIVFNIKAWQWTIVILAIALVIITEMINTAVEKLIDHIHPDTHVNIKQVKDMMAGVVLFASIISVILGLIVFLPYILCLL